VETRTRIEMLESDIEHLKIDVSDLKDDVRELRYGGILAFIILAGMIATAYLINDYKVNRLQESVSSLAVEAAEVNARMSGIKRQNRQILNRLEELTEITPGAPRLGRDTP
jgi:archaellum component FlaC